MPFAVIDDEALDPVDVSLLGANTVMFAADDVSHLIEQFGLPPVGVLTSLSAMIAILSSQRSNSSRIRPKFWVFLLKCPKIGSNSR
jgi:hypothetical protein